MYISFTPGNDLEETAALTAMGSCIADISQWMHTDKLKLNSYKTDCLLIGMHQQLQKVSNISISSVGDSQVVPACQVRNLVARGNTKILSCYTIAFPPSLAPD